MTNEERDLITQFIARVGGPPGASGFGSVPSTGTSNLPPIDPEADAFIKEQFAKYPEVRYRLTQLAFVQEHALTAAQSRITELQTALTQARQASTPRGASPWGQQGVAPAPQPSRGILGSLFGGGSSAPRPQPMPQQQYAPQPQQQYGAMPPMMAQQSGTGFLGGALRTAAGVAGGVVAGEALMNMFSGGHGGGMFGGGISDRSGGFDQGAGAAGGAWGAPSGGTDQFDQGGAMKDDASNTGGWSSPPQDQGGGWTDTSNAADTSGGWTDTSNVADTSGGWTDTSDSGGGGGGWDDTSNT